MTSFYLIIACMKPHSTAVIKYKHWALCQEHKAVAERAKEPDDGCVIQCVGGKVYAEQWKRRLER